MAHRSAPPSVSPSVLGPGGSRTAEHSRPWLRALWVHRWQRAPASQSSSLPLVGPAASPLREGVGQLGQGSDTKGCSCCAPGLQHGCSLPAYLCPAVKGAGGKWGLISDFYPGKPLAPESAADASGRWAHPAAWIPCPSRTVGNRQ